MVSPFKRAYHKFQRLLELEIKPWLNIRGKYYKKEQYHWKISVFAYINNSILYFTFLFKKPLLISCYDHMCTKGWECQGKQDVERTSWRGRPGKQQSQTHKMTEPSWRWVRGCATQNKGPSWRERVKSFQEGGTYWWRLEVWVEQDRKMDFTKIAYNRALYSQGEKQVE